MEFEYRKRRDRLKGVIEGLSADAFLVSSLLNIRYLCGFTGSNGFLLISDSHESLFTDSRYIEQASEETHGEIDVFLSPGFKGLTGAPGFNKINSLGFESENVTYSDFVFLSELLMESPKLIPTNGVIEKIRSIKGKEEIEFIKEAAFLADKAIVHALDLLGSGISESDIAWIIKNF